MNATSSQCTLSYKTLLQKWDHNHWKNILHPWLSHSPEALRDLTFWRTKLWQGSRFASDAAHKSVFNFKSLQITEVYNLSTSNALLGPRHRAKPLRNGNLALIVPWTKLPLDLCINLQQSMFFELWILLGGNSCSVSNSVISFVERAGFYWQWPLLFPSLYY